MEIAALIQKIVDEVKGVEGVQAVVLGGSRARGTHKPSSVLTSIWVFIITRTIPWS